MTGELVPVLTTYTARGLLLEGVPALRDPETGSLSFSADVAAVLASLEAASKVRHHQADTRAAAIATQGHNVTVQVLELLVQHQELVPHTLAILLSITPSRALSLLSYVASSGRAETMYSRPCSTDPEKVWRITDAGRAYLEQDRSTEAPG